MTYENERGTRWFVENRHNNWFGVVLKPEGHRYGVFLCGVFAGVIRAKAALTAMAEKNGWTLVNEKEA